MLSPSLSVKNGDINPWRSSPAEVHLAEFCTTLDFKMARGALVLPIALAVVLAVHTVDARKSTARKIRRHDPAPAEWDWRTKGAVPPVIDQGEIGNSLALDAAEVISSHGFIKSGNFVKASPEELIDCCLNTSASAVDSQLKKLQADDIYTCVVNLHGLCWEADYPPINGGQYAKPGDVEGIKSLVYRNPAVAYVDAGTISFQTYESGVYEDKSCDAGNVDHVLIVVGYGQKDGKDVWYCKNSWGANWGEEGYIYIARGENICGIESLVSIPV